jgi:hypothetical protein
LNRRFFRFSCVGERENLGNPFRIADFRIERQRLDAGVSRGFKVGEDQSKRGAGVGFRTRIDVEVGLAITALVPFSDHLTAANHKEPGRPIGCFIVTPGFLELVPINPCDLADRGLLLLVGIALFRQQAPPAPAILGRGKVVDEGGALA